MRVTICHRAGAYTRFTDEAADGLKGQVVPVKAEYDGGLVDLGTAEVLEAKVIKDGTLIELTVEVGPDVASLVAIEDPPGPE